MNFIGINTLDELIRYAQENNIIPETNAGLTQEDIIIGEGTPNERFSNEYDLEFINHFNILYNTAEGTVQVSKFIPGTWEYPAEGGEIEEADGSIEATTYMTKESLIDLNITHGSIENYIKTQGLDLLSEGIIYEDMVDAIATSMSSSIEGGISTSECIEYINEDRLNFKILEKGLANIQHKNGSIKPYIFFRIEFYIY